MKEVDFKQYCLSCGAWCCKGEKNILSGKKIVKSSKSGECVHLKNGLCNNYSKRPFDCRDFPLDVMVIKEKIVWVVWTNCPAVKEIDLEAFLEHTEKTLVKKYGKKQITLQAVSNQIMLPKKYKKKNMKILRDVDFG
jgi:Fe-S-cluster containining protein